MPSARSVLTRSSETEQPKRGWSDKMKATMAKKRERHQAIVAAALSENRGRLTNHQEVALGKTLRRSREDIKVMVEQAREELTAASLDYVTMHRQAVKDALANGDAKSLEVAVKGSQWAMQNISHDGQRIVDKPTVGESGGIKILIGIKQGGMLEPAKEPIIEAKVLPEMTPTEDVEISQ